MNQSSIIEQIQLFLEEDIGTGDITAQIIPEHKNARAEVITREAMVLCGHACFDAVFRLLDENVHIEWLVTEGDKISKDTVLCRLQGNARALLTGERSALNILQTMSATATQAREYADAVAGTECRILDTRKTLPGLRKLQKYAVACGGCVNHRIGLFDGILIKENHIIAAGSIAAAVQMAREISELPVEIEVENLQEFEQALAAAPDRIMLDNFRLHDLKAAVKLNGGRVELEASGNIDLKSVKKIAETGVDFISVGALTKNVKAIDLSMRINLVN
ncbi:carboxylating nicotinate-nucleotide diphosphorylase [Methylotuvimicrobium alcaliphilum]|uniref:Probable nicotinate-nucleotide pyrophosphorylase [carboxylating] n=1 Tax=Methylotuvimicrobium alcaliphilum (strain DSM 19304 / NCIMB 14124 / VKM B-2133 / 20Z) TaxID=1091494 RepID=G4SWL2_META2|nr:carboxylating nicotinate-nucleotide diphosphorylase [Methylotuvimicrobium alcaliphilum]CCE25238.1 nicotinate-nucleotide pyrophosphorylase [carboxylating] (Quinolinate phosphoribosyltransferase [decarboxylating]) (QAPRTase) [Methylotuvimicrobium alcaliphilum 20Z]